MKFRTSGEWTGGLFIKNFTNKATTESRETWIANLHENSEEFINAVNLASVYFHILPIIAEKDYYVTIVLWKLSD